MKHIIEIIKQITFIAFKFFLDIIKHTWEPILTLSIKIALLSLAVFLICIFIPHGLPFIGEISYIGWATIICLYNILTFKIEESFDSEYQEVLNKNKEDEIVEIQTDEERIPLKIEAMKDLISSPTTKEIEITQNESGSTRE